MRPRKTRSSGRRGRVSKAARRGRPKGSGSKARKGFGGDISGRLIADMRTYHSDLAAQCSRLQERMSALSGAIDTMAGLGAPTKGRRGPTSAATRGPRPAGGSLKEYITRVLGSAGSPLRLTDIAKGVKRAGYKTRSKNLPNQVSMALADLAKKRHIRKVSRGIYKA